MGILPVLAILFAGLESYALWSGKRQLEFIAKPAVMFCLSLWLYLSTGWQAAALWFGLGALLSLAGDVFLLWLDRFFVFGLAAFLLAHIAYLIGFNTPLPPVTMWSLLLAVIIGVSGVRVMRRLLMGVHASGQSRLAIPVALYGVVITLMLLSALLTLSNAQWSALASASVSLGALFFYASDIVLAWNKFIQPMPRGRILNIGLYHVGQILLIVGVVLQFS
ncbi:MAG: lysoplasmalogenase [Chloroflexi bacterium]|nr:lysoplasmalogenase [Chloroflexota bacterium]